MTNRVTTYVGAVPSAKDLLYTGQYSMTSIAKLAAGILGTSTVVNGFTCIPTTPASLNVILTPGEIYSLQNLEPTAWSALPADLAHSIMKQGYLLDNVTLAITPPGTTGYSQVYLLEVQYQDSDTNTAVLNYYNSSNPNSPFYGPPVAGTGSGAAQSTVRAGIVAYQLKAGVAATTGTQVAPSADVGWTPLFYITVANGATTITAGNITAVPATTPGTIPTANSAPYIPLTLPQIPQWVQGQTYAYGVDAGSANAIVATLAPAISAYNAGLRVSVKKIATPNSGAMTINLNGIGAVNLTDFAGNALANGAIPASALIEAVYDGTAFRMVGGSSSYVSNSQLSANSGEGVSVPVPSAAVTISIATPAVVTWTAHGLGAGTAIYFTTTGALPTGITANQIYYVISTGLTANSFEFSATSGGAAVATSGTQSGTQTCYAPGASTVNLNFPGLTVNNNIQNADVWGYYSSGDAHHRQTTWANVLTLIKAGLTSSLLNIQIFSTAGAFTYTPTAGTKKALVIATGGGGAGGCANGTSNACGTGGSAGVTAIALVTSPTSTGGVVGAGGVPAAATAATGSSSGAGGQTNFGTSAIAPGGAGGLCSLGNGNGPGITTGGTGLILIPGGSGMPTRWNSTGDAGGNGGASTWGPGGDGVDGDTWASSAPAPGKPAVSWGAGGGGSDTCVNLGAATQGGAGMSGVVVVVEFS